MKKSIKSAFTQLAIYVFYTARPKPINPIYWARKAWDLWGEFMLKLSTPALLELVRETARRSSSTGCGYGDYWSLYTTIRRLKPTNVVECGAGISTVVIAYAMRENEKNGKFISLEQAKFYFDNIVSVFPAELIPYVEIVLSSSVEVPVGDRLGCRYVFEPRDAIDFLYVDGPSLRKQYDNKQLPKAFNADILFIPKSDRFLAILDQRIGTMWILKSLLTDHDVRYNVMKRQTFITKKPRPQ